MSVILEDARPVARVQHRCDICGGVIAAGDRYTRQRGVWDGEAYTFKAHALCAAAHHKARRDLELYDDEAPDHDDDVLPLVRRFFANLTAIPPQAEGGQG